MTSSQSIIEKLHVQTYGNGNQVLVCLHGLGSNAKAWNKLIPYLENDFTVYTLDLPKYLDQEDKTEVSMAAYAELVAELVSTFGDDQKIHLVGHSMGGQVAIHLALTHPDMCCIQCHCFLEH